MKTFLEPFKSLTAVESLREALLKYGKVYDLTGCADKAHLIFGIGVDAKYKLITATGEKVSFDGSTPAPKEEIKPEEEVEVVYISEESGFTASNLTAASYLDMINGRGQDGKSLIGKRGGGSKDKVLVINHNGTTVGDNLLIFSGWCVIDGGVAKYVWSVQTN